MKQTIYNILGSDIDLNYVVAVGRVIRDAGWNSFPVFIGGAFGVETHVVDNFKKTHIDLHKTRNEFVEAWKQLKTSV